MRSGLVAVGAVFLAVAAVSAVSLELVAPTPAERSITSMVPPVVSGPSQTREVLLSGSEAAGEIFDLDWGSTEPFEVELFPATGCRAASLSCEAGPAMVRWSSNLSGRFATQGAMTYPLLLVWTDLATVSGSLWANATCTWDAPTTGSLWTELVEMTAAGALGIVGGILLFLGLFVRGGLYRGRSTGPGRDPPGPEGAAGGPDPAGPTAPRTDSGTGGTERPPRGPRPPDR